MMPNKRTKIIIGLQALLILVLFWMLIFYGKDEYANYRSEQEEEIEGLNRVVEKDGVSTIQLSPEVQKNSGISTVKLQPAQHKSTRQGVGNVVSIEPLIAARAQYLSLQSSLAAARAASTQNNSQYQRLAALNADDKNVSDRALQEAQALVNADQAKIAADTLALASLKNSLKLQWGETLAKLATETQLPVALNALSSHQNVLVQLTLPESVPAPKSGDRITIHTLGTQVESLTAHFISPATQTDNNLSGSTFFYSAPAAHLRVGMRLMAEVNAAEAHADSALSNGVIIPNAAVVWYAGQAWAYFKLGTSQFVRKPIATTAEVEQGWFNQNIKADSEVVISGAQLLLSEEFKYLIKNENED